jgi:hypothetical protein
MVQGGWSGEVSNTNDTVDLQYIPEGPRSGWGMERLPRSPQALLMGVGSISALSNMPSTPRELERMIWPSAPMLWQWSRYLS